MSTVLKLFKLQIDEIYNIFKSNNLKKLLLSLAKYVLSILVLLLAVYLILARVFYLGFELNENLIAIVLMLTQIIALIFAVENIISNLFLSGNNELLLTFPASANQIFLSKIMVIYVREVIVNSIYTLPLLLGMGIYGGFNVYYFLILFPLMLVLPLLPLSIAAMLSLPIMKVLKVLKKHRILSIVLMFSLLVAVLMVYVRVLSVFAGFDVGNDQLETVRRTNDAINRFGTKTFIFALISKSIINAGQFYYILLYAIIGILLFTGAAFLIRPFFFRTAIESREDSSQVAGSKEFKKYRPFYSLMKKEFLMVFRSPGQVFQYFIFALLMPIIVVAYDQLLLSMDIVTKTGRMMIAGAHVLIVAMLSMLSNIISASAISREGGNFYIIKTSPVSYYVQTGAKLVFNSLFSITAIIVTAIVTLLMRLTPGHALDVSTIVATSIAAIFASLAHMCMSFDMDLKNPTLNWYDSGDISNVNANTTKSLLAAVLISIIMAMIIFATTGSIIGWLALIVLCIVFFIRKIYVLILRVSYQYERQEM